MLVCLGLSRARPAWRPRRWWGVMLMAAAVFAAGIAPGLRLLAATLAAILALAGALELRRS
jgi:hypothetical protein